MEVNVCASRCSRSTRRRQKLDNAASNGFDYKVTLYQGYTRAATATETAVPDQCRRQRQGQQQQRQYHGHPQRPSIVGVILTPHLTGVTLSEGRFDGRQ